MFLNSISGPGTWYLPSAEHLRVAGSHSPYAAQVQAELMGKIVFEGKVDEVASGQSHLNFPPAAGVR